MKGNWRRAVVPLLVCTMVGSIAGMAVWRIEEYEAIRLIDLAGYTQEECASQMGIARTTGRGHHGFPYAALAADDRNYLFDFAVFIRRHKEIRSGGLYAGGMRQPDGHCPHNGAGNL